MTVPGIGREDCYNCGHEFHADICQKTRTDASTYRLTRPVVLGGPIPLCGCREWVPDLGRSKDPDGLTPEERQRRTEREDRIAQAKAQAKGRGL